MALLKTHWFAATNLLVALLVYVFYLISVSGIAEDNKKIADQIGNEINTIGAFKVRNPTEEWYKIVRVSQENLKDQADKIQSTFIKADNPIEKFFNINGKGVGVDIPDAPDRPQFKAVMTKKWDELLQEFSNSPDELKKIRMQKNIAGEAVEKGEEEEFVELKLTSRSVLQKLEPSWLRSNKTPKLDSDISIAQKRFWIIKSICELLRDNEVKNLSSLSVKKVMEDLSYKHKGKPFWVVRDIALSVSIEDVKVAQLMKSFFENEKLFTIVGLNQTNRVEQPAGVRSNAIFISFDKPFLVNLQLDLRHYDYRKEGAVIHDKPDVNPVSPSRGRARGRGRR